MTGVATNPNVEAAKYKKALESIQRFIKTKFPPGTLEEAISMLSLIGNICEENLPETAASG
jgi:hypothetical protein